MLALKLGMRTRKLTCVLLHRTALAEAELEYNEDHRSTAVYVKFPVVSLPPVLKDQIGMSSNGCHVKNSSGHSVESEREPSH